MMRGTAYRAVAVVAALFAVTAFAQELEISVSPTPVGSGARAAGMADAFVAIADDATAASWNPAGLVQLERPELSLVGSYNGIQESFRANFHDEFDSRHDEHNFDLNYASFVYPVPVLLAGRNVTLSLNYQRKYDFSRSFDVELNRSQGFRGFLVNSLTRWEFEQSGGLSTISPAIGIEVTQRLSLGATFNFWRDTWFSENAWEKKLKYRGIDLMSDFFGSFVQVSTERSKETFEDFSGENLTLGLLWNVTDAWSVGARYDTAFTGELRYKQEGVSIGHLLPGFYGPGQLDTFPFGKREKRHARFPASFALGAAWRPNDRLTLSLDVTRTDWDDFYVKDRYGNRTSLVDGSALNTHLTRPHFDPTYTVRFGAEYVFIPETPGEKLNRLWTLRGGLFYDEEPATGKPDNMRPGIFSNSGNPDEYFGFAAGVGLLTHQRVNIDAAYQLRYGQGVNRDFIRGVPGFREDVVQHRFLLSTVVYF